MIPTLASASIITDLVADFGAYQTAGLGLLAVTVSAYMIYGWVRGIASRAA